MLPTFAVLMLVTGLVREPPISDGSDEVGLQRKAAVWRKSWYVRSRSLVECDPERRMCTNLADQLSAAKRSSIVAAKMGLMSTLIRSRTHSKARDKTWP